MTANMYLGGDPTKVDASGYTFGDILAADITGTLEPVTVGPNGDVLTADSAAPEGVDYQAGGGGGSGTPSNTVVTETTFGQASTAGAASAYSRGDHTHGTPAAPSVPSAAGTVVAETTFGQASTAGAAATFSRGDHTHGTPASPTVPGPAATVVTETTFGQASAVGTGTTYARNDHTHGTPASPTVPSAAGTVVTETAFAQASAAGAAATFSRGDHTHGTPAAPTAASVAAVPLATATTKGDLFAATASATVTRQGVGADGTVLTAASGQATGMQWVAPTAVPSAAGTVAAETTYGIASAAGAAATFSRGDHTHGSPALGTTGTTAAAGNDSRITGAQPVATLTTKGDLYVATGASTVVRQGVGTNNFVLTADSAQTNGIKWAAAGGGSTLVVRRARVTSGDVSLNLGSGAWNLISGFSLAIPAVVGDYVELGVSFMSSSGNAFLDLAVVVSAAAVRYNSTDTATPATEGSPWLYKDPNIYRTAIMPWGFAVASGDLSGGNVTFGVAMKGTTGTLFSSTAYPFFWIAKNYGQANVA